MSQLPTTPAAVTVPARAVGETSLRTIHLGRDGLGFESLQTATCPQCSARPATRTEILHLQKPPGWLPTMETWASLPTVLALATALIMASGGSRDLHALGMLVLFFGPSVVLSHWGVSRILKSQRFRLKVQVCPACAAQLRHAQDGSKRYRRIRNVGAWMLVLLSPAGMGVGPASQMIPAWGVASMAAAVTSLAAWWMERRAASLESHAAPALLAASDVAATVAIPASWHTVLAAQQPAVLVASPSAPAASQQPLSLPHPEGTPR